MDCLVVSQDEGIATIRLARDKVNALNEEVVACLEENFKTFEQDDGIRSVILTGTGKFFSFGFDIPEFLSYSKESFERYVTAFARLYSYIFLFPKPVIAALNGHTIAGGCMLALACDHRVMIEGKARISLNEIGFGSSVFAGSVEMLRYCVGSKNAQDALFSGTMYSAREAREIGLIDEVAETEDRVLPMAIEAARRLGGKDPRAFASVKGLLRREIAERIAGQESRSIREFLDIWYSESTWKKLLEIKISR